MPQVLSVVVPAYNEEATLERIIGRLLTVPELLEIVIVNDCSKDGTAAIADQLASRHPQVRVAHHPVNRGKTEALKTGFAQTRGEIVIVQDADLEYDPAEIPEVIAPIIAGNAEVVYGSRFLVRKASRVLYFYHYLANKGLTFLSNLCTNINMTDVETCYKAFRGDIIRNMVITSSGFGFEIEVTAKIAKLGIPIYEVPISYYGRTYEQGKKIGMIDGFAALWYIFRFNFLCSVQKSFRELPKALPESKPAAIAKPGTGLCALAMLFFFLAACFFIPRIGTEDDELLFVPPVFHPAQVESMIKIGKRTIPTMLMSYVGADKTLLYGPIVRNLPPTLWSLRLPVVLIGVLTLWIFFVTVRRLAGYRVAVALVAILATDSMFLLSTTFDWGPVAIQHLLIATAFALLARPQPRVVLGFMALGAAFWDKGTASWTIGAFALSAAIFLPKILLSKVSVRNLLAAAGGFIAGAAPILAFNLQHNWATFRENAGFTTDDVARKVMAMWLTLSGRGMFEYMVGGHTPDWYSLTPFVLALAVPCLFLPRVKPVRQLALFSLSSGALIWLCMLFVRNGGGSIHHTILVWPWPHLAALCTLAYAFGESRAGRRAFAGLVLLAVASNVAMVGYYASRVAEFGPTDNWSDASLNLPRAFPGAKRVLTMDWGIQNVATWRTRGRVEIENRAFSGLTPDDLQNPDGVVFLSHVDGKEEFKGINRKAEAAITAAGFVQVVDQVFNNSRGEPVLRSFHCEKAAGAAGTSPVSVR